MRWNRVGLLVFLSLITNLHLSFGINLNTEIIKRVHNLFQGEKKDTFQDSSHVGIKLKTDTHDKRHRLTSVNHFHKRHSAEVPRKRKRILKVRRKRSDGNHISSHKVMVTM